MRRATILALLLGTLPLAQAASGSWSGQTAGPVLSVGRQIYTAPPLQSATPLPQGARLSRISWHIRLLAPPPPTLNVQLCDLRRCIRLPRLSGTQNGNLALAAAGPLRFRYQVRQTGQLSPPLHVLSNAVTLNYQWP